MTSLALSFNEVNFTPVQQNGQIWLTAVELAKALGYAKSDAVTQVYERNKDEFNTSMTLTLKLRVKGFGNGDSEKESRIFSLRGCHLIAMFSKTAIAKQFRKWVLDILDREVGHSVSKTTKKERVPLKDAVNMLVGKAQFLNYSDAYKLIHHRFNVEHIGDIPQEQIPAAVEYVHRLMGEYIPKVERIDPEQRSLELLAADTTNKVHDWIYSLCEELKRLKGNVPEFPVFDKETIARAVVTRIVQGQRMLLNISYQTGKPEIQFIPNNAWILDEQNIAKIIGDREGPKKELLPDIVQAAMSRLVK